MSKMIPIPKLITSCTFYISSPLSAFSNTDKKENLGKYSDQGSAGGGGELGVVKERLQWTEEGKEETKIIQPAFRSS